MNMQHKSFAKIRRAIVLATVMFGIFGGSANVSACSPASGKKFKPATNLDQVGIASTILIGKVVRWNAKWDKTHQYLEESSIEVMPMMALKGISPKSSFRLPGVAMTDKELYGRARPSHQDEFELPHVDAFGGGCNRSNFVVGQRVLFMLVRQDGSWDGIPVPFSRWAEDVQTLDAPWVQLVKIYVRASTLPKRQRTGYLKAERQRLLAGEPTRIRRLMADDIKRQITRTWSGRDHPDEDFLPQK